MLVAVTGYLSLLQANLGLFRHLKSPKVRSRGVGRPKSTQELSPHTVTILPGWLCGQNIGGLICKSPVTLKSRPPPRNIYLRIRLHILVYMPDHREKKSPSAKTVYMPVRIYAQPSGKFFAFGEKAIKKQHKTVICDQKFQKIFAFGENRIYAQPYI